MMQVQEGRDKHTAIDNEAIAKGVALLLKPLIEEAVKTSLKHGLNKLNAALAESDNRGCHI